MPGRTPSWYADPDDAALARWHDGQDWTEFTMVIAEWTSSAPPPPPAGWSPPASPTAGLTPAFGGAAPPPPATPAPDPAPPAAADPPADDPAAEPSAEEPEGPTPPPDAPDAGADEGPEPGEPAAEEAPDDAEAPEAAAPAGEEPRGFARLGAEPGTRAFGTAAPAPKDDDEATPPGEPDDPAAFEDLPAQRGVRIDAETAGPDPDEPEGPDDEDDLDDEPTSGSVQAVGPEAPGIDWGVGPEALKPLRRPSGWHLDEDGNPIGEPIELPKRTLGQQYRHAPIWARIAIPLVLVGLVALAVTSFLGGDDGDDGTDRLFTQRDGTLDDDALDEPGMDDALTRARQQGAPTEITDKDLSGLIKGVCTAARRSLVSLNLSQALVDTGLEIRDLGEAATAIGNGALEYCPDQEASLGQVVSVLITRTQRMLATSTTT